MLDTDTGELVEKTIEHQGERVREFYSTLNGKILVGIEATGSMQWFLWLMGELGIECRVGHPAKIRKAETRNPPPRGAGSSKNSSWSARTEEMSGGQHRDDEGNGPSGRVNVKRKEVEIPRASNMRCCGETRVCLEKEKTKTKRS
jgi:hypothetical protein